jgi:pyruvate ferredoxin oxidoreductase gamma subunit/phenylglyoxylate dehydrogenase gamma subunit
MYEIRFHGRGGQGAVLAGGILAAALVQEGKFVIAVPSFGFERRGAPVASFLRLDEREIRQMTNIYHPDCVICIDPTVSRSVNIFDGIRENATLVQTTSKPLAELQLHDRITTVGLCDAVSIALEIFKRPITNTLMLGAFARTTGLVSLDALRAAVEDSDFRDAGLRQNLEALERGYNETRVHKIALSPSPSPEAGEGGVVAPSARKSDGRVAA